MATSEGLSGDFHKSLEFGRLAPDIFLDSKVDSKEQLVYHILGKWHTHLNQFVEAYIKQKSSLAQLSYL